MTRRIFHSICLAALAVFLASLVLILGMLYSYFSEVQYEQLRTQTVLAARGVEEMGLAYLEDLTIRSGRITWINPTGKVLYDSQADTAQMENHLEREEIQEALATGWGRSERWSVTLLKRSLYEAARLSDGSVLRLSATQNTVLTLVLGMIQPIIVVFALAVILSVVLARQLSARIVRPLNELDLDDPVENGSYEELSPLLGRIARQQKQLAWEEERLRRKQEELDAVTGNMREGLVLLGRDGKILSINPAAQTLLDTDRFCVGKDLLTVNRSLDIQAVVEKAQTGVPAEKTVSLHGGRYLADASPVAGESPGVALLLFDVTEKERAEQMRREFTANVSHELRTPLTTISGCAELLKNGLVKPEDATAFAGSIYAEAQRMVRLVDDILSLSHLDEGAEDLKREPVDLYAIAGDVVDSLTPKAQAAGVILELAGGPAKMEGSHQLLREIVFNLCDNAVKYNRPEGKVTVRVEAREKEVCLEVQDTGIGIAPEHQAHVFERFYRADRSRSRAVEGTGLGLSIVKHAVMVHGGSLNLHSVPGEGTTVTVRFPA